VTTHSQIYSNEVLVGKSIDADELSAYRSSHNDATAAWIKRTVLIGSGVVGAFFVYFGIGRLVSGGGGGASAGKKLK